MLNQDERRNTIVQKVVTEGEKSVDELSRLFQVSLQTIRADVRFLTERGKVFRTHGGVAAFQRENVEYHSRELHNREGKERIGAAVVSHLSKGSHCFLGTGTTVEMVTHALNKDITLDVYTNNLYAASHLCDYPNINITIAGGLLRKRDRDIIGGDALNFFQRYRAQVGVVSVGGIDAEGYLYDYKDSEVMAREALCKYAQLTILVVDSGKKGIIASCQNGHIRDFNLVVADFAPTEEIASELKKSSTIWETV
ncbi:DeoR/GlpR transcriptional regulator [Vibrio sp. HA2012]|uniref:DeoR/GlpR family DNA-binding transcription regulator n=1 Tax=Vibrio sp. HA2012 TaxID=1971595 RepID=UPI000C2C16F1|nr:DeoR/GlpR family DNA-binding transcription regulator [Vibrio sp. HA2012]PJC86661.1 DeoR/GlpR transcriptional regulator [Vibrio sp. HA2012]